jgi:hypothetical protein
MLELYPGAPSLCRRESQTCGACCWGASLDQETLAVRLRRNTRSFLKVESFSGLTATRMLWHEIRTQRGMNLLWAVLLRLPWISRRLKRRLAPTLVCPFIGFDSADEQKVGCMLHPSRNAGLEVRGQFAFRWLPGIECGDTHYVCNACHHFDTLPAHEQNVFSAVVSDMDWFDYTNTVRAFSCGLAGTAVATRNRPLE